MYDPVGRLAETYVANATIPGVRAEQVTYAYGPAGEVSATAADGGTTRYFFDNRGEIAEGEDPLGNFTHYVYDSNYNLTEVIDPAGQATRFAYDPNGHLMQTTDPDGHTVQYTHSGPFNELSSYTDPDGNTTTYQYNSQGDLLSITYPNGTQQQFSYDPLGNLTETINGRGQAIHDVHNSAGLLTEEDFADGTKITYSYNAVGDMLTATNASGTTTFRYDPTTDDLLQRLLSRRVLPDFHLRLRRTANPERRSGRLHRQLFVQPRGAAGRADGRQWQSHRDLRLRPGRPRGPEGHGERDVHDLPV